MNPYNIVLCLALTVMKLDKDSMHWQALLVMIPKKNFKHAFEISIGSLRRLVLPHKPNFYVYILVDYTFVSL